MRYPAVLPPLGAHAKIPPLRAPKRMTPFPRRLLLSLAALLVAAHLPALEILPVDEVKPGMIGEGRSVFVGDEIETFEVEILSVVRNADPGRHMILGEARGGPLGESGIQRVMMVRCILNGVFHRLDNMRKRRRVWITDPKINNIAAFGNGLLLRFIDFHKKIWRNFF